MKKKYQSFIFEFSQADLAAGRADSKAIGEELSNDAEEGYHLFSVTMTAELGTIWVLVVVEAD